MKYYQVFAELIGFVKQAARERIQFKLSFRRLSEHRKPTAEKLILTRFSHNADEIRPVFHPCEVADAVQIRSKRNLSLHGSIFAAQMKKSESKKLPLATASILGQPPSQRLWPLLSNCILPCTSGLSAQTLFDSLLG